MAVTQPTHPQQHFSAAIPMEAGGKRLDAVVAQLFPSFSREQLKRWIKAGQLTVDEVTVTKPNYKVLGGEQVVLAAVPSQQVAAVATPIPLDIVYEDVQILVLNKPAGLVVHPGAGTPDGTLMNGLLYYMPELETLPRAGIVHRLDKDTTGLMVVAKTSSAYTHLVAQLSERKVTRIYDAIVQGELISGGTIEKNIGRHPKDRKRMAALEVGGKPAVTHYRIAERFRGFTHVKVRLETGRTHQIRVHMAMIGHALVGDPVYGGRLKLPKGMAPEFIEQLRAFKRQALHAGKLGFIHPESGKPVSFTAPMPEDMALLIDLLRDEQDVFLQEQQGEDDWEADGIEIAWVSDDGVEQVWE